MNDEQHNTEGLVLQGLISLYDAKSTDETASAPELLPIFSGLKPEAPHYTDKTLIARGGMKSIFKVYDPKTARYVAMATLNADSPEELYEPFLREARLTALLDHPNIITIHDIGLSANAKPYFTMELKTGKSLEQIIQIELSQKGKTTAAETINGLLNIFLKICDAIDYAHSQNVLHLDLKPDNIQVGHHGEVVICDWGLGKLIGDASYDGGEFDRLLLNPDLLNNMTLSGHIKGTPGFMAPEQVVSDGEKTFQTDIYALGAILYAILTNHTPIEGKTTDELISNTAKGTICSPSERFPLRHIPPALSAVALKALATDPARRYESVRALRNDLTSYLNGFSTAAENAGILKEVSLFYRRQKKVVNLSGLFLLILCSAVLTAFLSVRRSEQAAVSALRELKAEKKESARLGEEAAPQHYEIAMKALAQGHVEQAFKHAKTAVALNAEYKEASNLLAVLYFMRGQHEEAARTFRNGPLSLYRKLRVVNDAFRSSDVKPKKNYKQVEELLNSCSQIIPTPLTTALFLHWIYDDQEEYRTLALRYFTIRKEMCTTILTFAQQQDNTAATEALVTRVLETLTLSPDWISRRIPATLGMKLSRNPDEKKQFRKLIPKNLALGQPVVSMGGNRSNPEFVVDGKTTPESFWSTTPYPSSLSIDLGDVHVISHIRVNTNQFVQKGDTFKYTLSLSSEERQPKKIIIQDETGDNSTTCHDYIIEPTAARFIRFKILYHSGKVPLHVREIEVY